jgi:hypothetical protein
MIPHAPDAADVATTAERDRRIEALIEEGWEIFERFDENVRQKRFHPFVAADYHRVLAALRPVCAPGLRFVEWGSATGVITIMASLLGCEAYGIELDPALVRIARELGAKFGSSAVFAEGSFLPTGYRWRPSTGDGRLGTIGDGPSAYPMIGRALDDFDLVYAYPWGGEEPMMLDLMRAYGRRGALLLMHGDNSVRTYADGRQVG